MPHYLQESPHPQGRPLSRRLCPKDRVSLLCDPLETLHDSLEQGTGLFFRDIFIEEGVEKVQDDGLPRTEPPELRAELFPDQG